MAKHVMISSMNEGKQSRTQNGDQRINEQNFLVTPSSLERGEDDHKMLLHHKPRARIESETRLSSILDESNTKWAHLGSSSRSASPCSSCIEHVVSSTSRCQEALETQISCTGRLHFISRGVGLANGPNHSRRWLQRNIARCVTVNAAEKPC